MQILFQLLDLSSSTSKRPFQCLPLFNDIYFSYSELFCSFCFSSDLYIEQILCKGTWRAVSLLVSLIFFSHHHSAAATFFILGSTNYCSQEETLAVIQPHKEGMSASMMERATQGTSRCKRLHSSTVAGPILHIAMLQEVRCCPVIDLMVICYFNIIVLDGISNEMDHFICISLVNAQYTGGTRCGTTVDSYVCIKLKRNRLRYLFHFPKLCLT